MSDFIPASLLARVLPNLSDHQRQVFQQLGGLELKFPGLPALPPLPPGGVIPAPVVALIEGALKRFTFVPWQAFGVRIETSDGTQLGSLGLRIEEPMGLTSTGLRTIPMLEVGSVKLGDS